ncbi:hypothetical protein SSX86_020129 [Deinandra increscens subsp. villosa]|uniref:Uncharacterized protein n=1 Tax=Deinandra increscens subsp. villosa TaxID=3103831 RepID=A0AAP0GW73_9ASTR
MSWNSGALRPPLSLRLRGLDVCPPGRKLLSRRCDFRFSCSCSDKAVPNRRIVTEERQSDLRKNSRVQATPAWRFASSQPQLALRQERYFPRCAPKNSGPQYRDTPPKRDMGIANAKDWGITLLTEQVNESGINEDGSTWYRESGEDLGENGYRCRWTKMGGQSSDGSSKWKEAYDPRWIDLTGFIYLLDSGGRKVTGLVLRNLEKILKESRGGKPGEKFFTKMNGVVIGFSMKCSNIAKIERSAQKQAKSGTENAGWYENWWEKYDAKGWTEKGAHKYGRLNEQSWWEKWGEHYDGRGSVLKWTDKWAETELGTKWGDKWEEKFFAGVGSRQGETWHVTPAGERWSRTWGEEHFGNGKVHKYGKSTTDEGWDIVVDEETYYKAEPHYGWAEVVGDSSQLLSIEPRDKPPGVYPFPDFGSSPLPPQDGSPPSMPPPQNGSSPPSMPPQDGSSPPSMPPRTQ